MSPALYLAGLLASAPALTLHTSNGLHAVLAQPGVVIFWRSDCAPCQLEVRELSSLRRAAAPLVLHLVNLDARPEAEGHGAAVSLRTDEDPRHVLTSWGGAPPRLPLAVALDARGLLCARHTGLIGRDRLKAWAQACGGALARR